MTFHSALRIAYGFFPLRAAVVPDERGGGWHVLVKTKNGGHTTPDICWVRIDSEEMHPAPDSEYIV